MFTGGGSPGRLDVQRLSSSAHGVDPCLYRRLVAGLSNERHGGRRNRSP
jgi:hypothetical protein